MKKKRAVPGPLFSRSDCGYLLLEPPVLFEVSLFGVESPIEPELGLLLELEPMLPELPLVPLPVLLPEDDVPPDALDEPCAAFHSSRLIWPSWFLSSLSNSLSPLAPEDALEPLEPPAALLDDLSLEPEAPEVALGEAVELEPPAAELLSEDEDDGLLCDIDGEDDWAPFCFAASSA